MSTQITNDEPVLVLDDKKYLIENLSDDAKFVVGALQDLSGQLNAHQIRGLQLTASQESLTAKLKQLVEESDLDEVIETPAEDG